MSRTQVRGTESPAHWSSTGLRYFDDCPRLAVKEARLRTMEKISTTQLSATSDLLRYLVIAMGRTRCDEQRKTRTERKDWRTTVLVLKMAGHLGASLSGRLHGSNRVNAIRS
jgi:hypothetical protein